MKGFTVILRALLRGMFRKKAGRSGMTVSAIVGMLIAASIIAAVLSVVMGLLGNAAREYGLATEVVALLFAADFIITLVFGVTAVMSSMWSARDGEFFASLPVSSNAVMLAKLTSAYIQDGAVSCILVLPPAITFGAVAGMGALYYVMTVLAIILVPLAALLLAAIISVPLAFVSGFFRNRGAAAAVLLLALFTLLMTAYILLVGLMPATVPENTASIGEMIAAAREGMKRGLYIVYPVYCLARFGCGGEGLTDNAALSAVADLGIFIGSVVILAALLLPITALFYRRIISRQSESAPVRHAGAKSYTEKGVLAALVGKERKMLLRDASFAFQCLGGIVLTPIISIMMFVIASTNIGDIAGAEDLVFIAMWQAATAVSVVMIAASGMTALTSVTREGQTFVYSKTIPVPYSVQLSAKRIIALVPALCSSVVTTAGMAIAGGIALGKADALAVISTLLILSASSLLSTEAFILRDLSSPRLDWVTPREAVKNNIRLVAPVLTASLVSAVIAAIIIAGGIALYFVGTGNFSVPIVTLPVAAVEACLFFPVHARLRLRADKLYERLSV